jgi:hypothetical protein
MSFDSGMAAASCAIIGSSLLGYGLYLRNKLRSGRGWPQVTGTVAQSEIEVDDGYRASVTYEYTVNGVGYSSSSVQFDGRTEYLRKSSAEAFLSQYPARSHVTVYYDPENPAEAVLNRTSPAGLQYIVCGIVLLVVMVLVILYPAHDTASTNP